MHPTHPPFSRTRLARLPLALAMLGALAALGASRAPDAGAVVPSTDWLDALDAPHRMLFDTPAPNDGIPLVHTLNYMNSWNAEGAPDADIDAVVTLYGATTFHGLDDAMWAKYDLGEVMGERDLDGVAFRTNPWRVAPIFDGATLPPAGIESLSARGATFIMCNNALTFFAAKVAAARGLDTETVYADMKVHILPEVTLVPAMVVALDRAQQAGLSYHRQ